MPTSIVIEGKISVDAVLRSPYRKVLTIFYDVEKSGGKGIQSEQDLSRKL